MIFPCKALADGTLHQTGQRREDVDWRVDLPVMELTVDEDLAFRNVASQIRNGMCDI